MILLRKVTAAGAWKAPGHNGAAPPLSHYGRCGATLKSVSPATCPVC